MGKVKRMRLKYKTSAKREGNIILDELAKSDLPSSSTPGLSSRLSNCDARSAVTRMSSATSVCKDGNKLQRRINKHEDLMHRLISRRDKDLVKKAKCKRQKTKVVGDMRPMSDALPSLQQLLKDTQVEKERIKAESTSKKQHHLSKRMDEDYKLLNSIAEFPDYQKDMGNLVKQSIQERLRISKEQLKETK